MPDAQVQQVRYNYPIQEPNPFLTAIQGGMAGYFGRQKEKSDFQKDILKSAFSNMVATQQVKPTQPGEQGIQAGDQTIPWAYQKPPVDVGNYKNQLESKKLAIELGIDEPTAIGMQNMAREETERALAKNAWFNMSAMKDPAATEQFRELTYQQTLARIKKTYGQKAGAKTTTPPAEAAYYSASADKYYDAQGNEL